MPATLGELPPRGSRSHEIKWDGMRIILAISDATQMRATSHLADVSRSFPELLAAPAQFGGRRLLLDGELVALDEHGMPSLARLQRRMLLCTLLTWWPSCSCRGACA
ncbi:hypothetical protein AB0M43_36380 [Longispora sp. NPDC051575]|uniref:ATP-dependent DNA ligase n=1 Tax=Longispora sp. NPDC051575 TaxID=3154943 RepID=UPI003412BDF9